MYEKINFKDRVIERPMTFNVINNDDGTVTLEPVTGEVYEEGTKFNSVNMDHIEDGILENSKGVNELKNSVYIKDNFALVSGSISLQGMETDILTINLPTGWTNENCFIIGVKYTKNNSWPSYTSYDDYIKTIQMHPTLSRVSVTIYNYQSNAATYNVTLLLLKYSD